MTNPTPTDRSEKTTDYGLVSDLVYGAVAREANNHGGMYEGKEYYPEEAIDRILDLLSAARRDAVKEFAERVKVDLGGHFYNEFCDEIEERWKYTPLRRKQVEEVAALAGERAEYEIGEVVNAIRNDFLAKEGVNEPTNQSNGEAND